MRGSCLDFELQPHGSTSMHTISLSRLSCCFLAMNDSDSSYGDLRVIFKLMKLSLMVSTTKGMVSTSLLLLSCCERFFAHQHLSTSHSERCSCKKRAPAGCQYIPQEEAMSPNHLRVTLAPISRPCGFQLEAMIWSQSYSWATTQQPVVQLPLMTPPHFATDRNMIWQKCQPLPYPFLSPLFRKYAHVDRDC